jgi:hypothetical protein
MKSQILTLSNPLWQEILQQVRHDIYQLPEYISLEANRSEGIPEAIAITKEDKIFFIPYLISKCEEDIWDIKSPYGYPGILLSPSAISDSQFITRAWTELRQILSDKNVCSVFLRMHPILNENFEQFFLPDSFTPNGETVSIDLRIPESQLWSHTRKGHKSTINKCKREGMEAKFVPIEEYLGKFTAIYQETMARVRATDTYYSFDLSYYQQMSRALGDKLHLCIVEYENEIACAGLYTEVCGIVQSTLGGTKDKFVHLSPSSLETDFARYWAHRRGNEFLHLGGGVGGEKDYVYNFKAGFSKLRHQFYTMRLVLDREKYDYLIELRVKELNSEPEKLKESGFFPAYRAL